MKKNPVTESAAEDLSEILPMLLRYMSQLAEQAQNYPRVVGEVLMSLDHLETSTITELSTRLHRPKSNLTPVIENLVQQNMVSRIPNKQDRRVVNLRLTNEGTQAVKSIKETSKNILMNKLDLLQEEEVLRFSEAIKVVRETFMKIVRLP